MLKPALISAPTRKLLLSAIIAATLAGCSSNSNDNDRQQDVPESTPTSGESGNGDTDTEGEDEDDTSEPPVALADYTIEVIENCGEESQNAEGSTVFEDETIGNIVGGGGITEHPVQDPEYPDDPTRVLPPWSHLALDWNNPLYDLANVQPSADSSCNDLLTTTGVIVTKYANWEHQHSNEFVPPLLNANRTFNDVDEVVLELKLNSDNTVIYTNDELASIYAAKLAEVGQTLATMHTEDPDLEIYPRDDIDLADFDFERLDQEKAVLAVSLQNQATGADNVQLERYIEIDPELYLDKWIRITIPVEAMDYFTGEVWVKDTPPTTAGDTPVNRMHIVGEILGTGETKTQYGDVLRNYIGSPSSHSLYDSLEIPETFKEMSITIKKIEVVWE